MSKFRYDTAGSWFKGNTHLHSDKSDGGCDFKTIAEMYHGASYDFLFRTDHWVASDVGSDKENYPLLWLDGVELNGHDHTGAGFHVVCLGTVSGMNRDDGLEKAMLSARAQGALLILAHPHWCGNSLEDCLRWDFDGVEVYNHVCHWLNGKSGGLVHWDAALMRKPGTLALAVDDAHLKPAHPGWNGGWLMVNAAECTRDAIMDGIRCGNFYSSCGPEIRSITYTHGELRVETSPVRFVRLVGPGSNGRRGGAFDGALRESTAFELPPDWRYAYLEIEDEHGRKAWSNSLIIE